MPRYSIEVVMGPAALYVNADSPMRQKIAKWGNDGYEVIRVFASGPDIVVTLQKSEG